MATPDVSPRRFSDAQRALDPLLCEEDTNEVFRIIAARDGTPRSETALKYALSALCFAVAVGVLGFFCVGPPALSLEAAFLPSVAAGLCAAILSRRVLARLSLMDVPRRGAEYADLRPGESISQRPLPFLECGASARDVVVAEYLARRMADSFIPVRIALRLVLAGAAINPILSTEALGQRLGVVAVTLYAIHRLGGWMEAESYRRRVLDLLELPTEALLARMGFTPSRLPREIEQSMRLRPRYATELSIMIGVALLSQLSAMALVLSGVQSFGGWGAIQWTLVLLAFCAVVSRWDSPHTAVTAGFQRAWIELAAKVRSVHHGFASDDSEDARRWAKWMLSPCRGLDVPCADVDDSWMASDDFR